MRRAPRPSNRPGDARGLLRPETSVFCAWVRDQAFAYLEDDLSAPDRRALKAHLNDCADCRIYVAECRQVDGILTAARQSIPAPGDLRGGFYASLAASDAVRKRRRANLRLAVPAFAVGLIACLFGVRFLNTPTSPGLAAAVTDSGHGSLAVVDPMAARILRLNESNLSVGNRHEPSMRPADPSDFERPVVLQPRFVLRSSGHTFASLSWHPKPPLPNYNTVATSMVASLTSGGRVAVASDRAAVRVAALLSEDMDGNGLVRAKTRFNENLNSWQADVKLKGEQVTDTPLDVDDGSAGRMSLYSLQAMPYGDKPDRKITGSGDSYGTTDSLSTESATKEVSLHISDDVRGFSTPAHVSDAVDERIDTSTDAVEAPVEQPPLPANDVHY